ncbi:MAG: anthranilate phosphoribosyltransferase [Syntrophales bacterium]|jgi:anthranilate phosphoribosyltransferase|nr:anthranilate phosphoribosyltransferase [Syntrophales bacterium]MDY0043220.1 anthranilate phosphoribosyltransferase [Syntrophales bacterium]
MIKEAIALLVEGHNLSEREMMAVMDEIMEGDATEAQMGAFITGLRMKGETVDEITGAARIMRRRAVKIDARASVIVDTCGTGGDGKNTFNISTTAAFVVSAAGITVAKHGNRAVSSGCGSADVLEALGVNIRAEPETVEESLQEIGIGFLFAQSLHGAMKYAAKPRKEVGVRTIFNMLGPLANPAGATSQLIGVYDPELTETFTGVLKKLGTKRAFVVHGADGLDEATVTGHTRISELHDGIMTTCNLDPLRYFKTLHSHDRIQGGNADANAKIAMEVLTGTKGAARDIVLLNSGLAIMAGEKARTLEEGISIAEHCIDEGFALQKLRALIEITNR